MRDTPLSEQIEAAAAALIECERAGIKPPAILGPTLRLLAPLAAAMEAELAAYRALLPVHQKLSADGGETLQ
jgi:hypothetical protein